MARTTRVHRKVEPALWFDDVFRALSAPRPNAQTLWLYLLTGPRTTMIPGVVMARPAVMADDLRWPPRKWDAVMGEIVRAELALADLDAGLIVLTNALIHRGIARETSRPNGANAIKAWWKTFDELPKCDLRESLRATLTKFFALCAAENINDYAETIGMVGADHNRHHRPTIPDGVGTQDQKQEQDQKQDTDGEAPASPSTSPSFLTSPSPKPPKAKRPRRSAEGPMPDGFAASDAHRAFAAENQLDIEVELKKFTDHHRAKGSTWASWPHALSKWLTNAVEYRRRDGPPRFAPSPAPGRAPPAQIKSTDEIDPTTVRPRKP